MEPRKRSIKIVNFWETDDQRRRVKLREAPIYDLARGTAVIAQDTDTRAEEALEIAQQGEDEPEDEPLRLFAS